MAVVVEQVGSANGASPGLRVRGAPGSDRRRLSGPAGSHAYNATLQRAE